MAKTKRKLLGRTFGRKPTRPMAYCFIRPTSDGGVSITVPSVSRTLLLRDARDMFEYGLRVCEQQDQQ